MEGSDSHTIEVLSWNLYHFKTAAVPTLTGTNNITNMNIERYFGPEPMKSYIVTVFARSNTAIVGSNPTEAWMFVCVFSVST
jgi:hypothetical protein